MNQQHQTGVTPTSATPAVAPSKASAPLSNQALLEALFQGTIDLGVVRYTRDGLTPKVVGASNTLGNTIHLRSNDYFDAQGQVSPGGMEIVIHELHHVWQYQQGGWDYLLEAGGVNVYHQLADGDRKVAYEYDTSMAWEDMNPEQQASAIDDAGMLMWRQATNGTLTPNNSKKLAERTQYIDAMRQGRNP